MPSYDPSGYGRTLADLMRRRGEEQAALELHRGDIEANMWQQAGQSIMGAVSGWQRNVEDNRRLEMERAREARRAEVEGMQMESARMDLDTKRRTAKGAERARSVLPLARRDNGVVGYDRDLIAREMAGYEDMLPQIFERLDEQEASHYKVIEAKRDAIAGDAWRVLQGGGADDETFNAMLDLWGENDLAPKREIDAMRKAAKGEGVERALMAAVQSSPKYSELLMKVQQASAPELTSFPVDSDVFNKRTGELVRPGQSKPPTNIEDAILKETDPVERQRLIDLKKELTAAGRAPAQPVQPPPVQSKSVINDKGELVEGYFDPRARLYYDAQGNVIQNPKPASSREQGRQVTSGDAGDIAEFNTALDDVAMLRETLAGNKSTGASAQVGAALPNIVTEYTGWGTDAKQKQAVIDRVKQVIGKAFEGGVLRKEDERKYAKILPTIGDPPEVVATKLDGLDKAIQQRQRRKIDALRDAGYDTSKYEQRQRQPAGGGPIRMLAPDGRELMVPADKVDEAKRRGAKVVG